MIKPPRQLLLHHANQAAADTDAMPPNLHLEPPASRQAYVDLGLGMGPVAPGSTTKVDAMEVGVAMAQARHARERDAISLRNRLTVDDDRRGLPI